MRRRRAPIIGDPNDPKGMIPMLNDYLEWRRIKNFSKQTVTLHRIYLGYFINWCAVRGITQPLEVTKPIIERYQRYLFHYRKKDGDPLSTRTQHGFLIPLRAWFKWLTRQNHILYNPASEIDL